MKLSYRDRIILIVAIIIAILAIGIFALIRPAAKNIKANKATLANTEKVWADTEKKIAEIPNLQKNITDLHTEAKEKASYFTEQRSPYELDQFIQKYLDENKMELKAGSGLGITDVSTTKLEFYYYTPDVLSYALYEHADLDGSLKKALEEEMKMSTTLSARTEQTVLCSSLNFVANTTKEDLGKFLQKIKDLDTSILVTSVEIGDYTFYPEIPKDKANATAEEKAKLEEKIDHADVTINMDFYSVQTPTEPYTGD